MSLDAKGRAASEQQQSDGVSSCCSVADVVTPTKLTFDGKACGIRTDIRIQQMDCPTEERMISKKLATVSGVISLEFDLLARVLTVQHSDAALESILLAIKSLGFEPQVDFKDEAISQGEKSASYLPLTAALALALGSEAIAWFSDLTIASLAMAVAAMGVCGLHTYRKGWQALISYNLNINALMSIAVTGAFLLGQWSEGAMVMVLFTLAERLEQNSLQRAGQAIKGLLQLKPELTTVRQLDGSWLEMATDAVIKGALVRVRPGERISLDGVVTSGHSSVDQSPITGESMPVDKSEGEALFAGTINTNGVLEYQVSAVTADTTLAAIIKVVAAAQRNKAPIQRFIDKFAAVYTPLVLVLAVLVALLPPLLVDGNWQGWIYKALVLLVIACPCALVISTPVTIVSGLTAAARRGILIKGGVHLERGRHIKWLALDKTGTITQGKPVLTDSLALTSDAGDYQQLALSLAALSNHPVANAIATSMRELGQQELAVSGFEAVLGSGISGKVNARQYYLANQRWASKLHSIAPEQQQLLDEYEASGKTVNFLLDDKQLLAIFAVADKVKQHSAQAVEQLHHLNIKTIMLSGDNLKTANVIAAQVAIDHVAAEQLPEDKLQQIEKLQKNAVVAMVGDGINDAPALARADVGFAMGALGSDTAIETADVALMDDDLRKIPEFIVLSKRVHSILVQNISFAIAIKLVFLVVTLIGMGDMWMAVFADVGASLLVVANGLRLLKMNRVLS
ncbi:4-deoxy-4-formamido-L-arabinose-phospho-UDP deformylase ['Osedax' symbiont bacterium Rs2_46_30_T18]|nr:4-deoxy-4-formamido-L-arabinose-phospho-UDP deformylase ['Osedax' symbiont bacterium Rs2_46_30_T18]